MNADERWSGSAAFQRIRSEREQQYPLYMIAIFDAARANRDILGYEISRSQADAVLAAYGLER